MSATNGVRGNPMANDLGKANTTAHHISEGWAKLVKTCSVSSLCFGSSQRWALVHPQPHASGTKARWSPPPKVEAPKSESSRSGRSEGQAIRLVGTEVNSVTSSTPSNRRKRIDLVPQFHILWPMPVLKWITLNSPAEYLAPLQSNKNNPPTLSAHITFGYLWFTQFLGVEITSACFRPNFPVATATSNPKKLAQRTRPSTQRWFRNLKVQAKNYNF